MDIQPLGFHAVRDSLLPIVFLYIGPETMLPLASALAAVAGFVLMFWNRFLGVIRSLWRRIVGKNIVSR